MAGATGFVGTYLRRQLRGQYRLICLTRSTAGLEQAGQSEDEEWRACDLFSLLELENALAGADYAIYLVHSMLPSARLLQGTFSDLDLIMADNFARAARKNKLKQILYLGGIIPDEEELSRHLASRLEVEHVLGSSGIPVTALRAGIIIGPGGSSFQIVVNLVNRLPFMTLPGWTRTRTQPISIKDVVRAFALAIGNPDFSGQHFDIGGPDIMSYRDMLKRTARFLGLKRLMLNVPFFSPKLSILWVSLFGSAPKALVGPLVSSLRHPMVARPNPLLSRLLEKAVPFEASLRDSVGPDGRLLPNPRDPIRRADDRSIKQGRKVRSVQRLTLPRGWTARDVMEAYYQWLPKCVGPFLKSRHAPGGRLRLSLFTEKLLLIEFTHSPGRSSQERQLLYITGGILARTRNNRKGRIEFREMLDRRCLIAAIHDYTPTLPWPVYSKTQALIHLLVMSRFARFLKKMDESPPK